MGSTHVGLGPYQHTRHFLVPARGRVQEGRGAIVSRRVDIRLALQQPFNHPRVAFAGSGQKGGVSRAGLGV